MDVLKCRLMDVLSLTGKLKMKTVVVEVVEAIIAATRIRINPRME